MGLGRLRFGLDEPDALMGWMTKPKAWIEGNIDVEDRLLECVDGTHVDGMIIGEVFAT